MVYDTKLSKYFLLSIASHFSFERFVPGHFYRKAYERLQNIRDKTLGKIPRIRIQSAKSNSEIEVSQNPNADNEMYGDNIVQTNPGKGKGKQSKPKSSIEL